MGVAIMAETPEIIRKTLVEHRFMSRNQADRTGCRGCAWTGTARAGTDQAWAQYAEHIATICSPKGSES